jgi:hypothetical protein
MSNAVDHDKDAAFPAAPPVTAPGAPVADGAAGARRQSVNGVSRSRRGAAMVRRASSD